MRSTFVLLTVAAALAIAPGVGRVQAHDDEDRDDFGGRRIRRFQATLFGNNEVPPISTKGSGHVRLAVDETAQTIAFTLSYSGLEGGTANVAHVHFAPTRVNGGIMFFLCGGARPACPPTGGVVTGTVMATDIIGPNGQGVAPGEFDAVVRNLRAGLGYANVHTTTYPAGEIRGQVNPR
jgi:hypothetical protein